VKSRSGQSRDNEIGRGPDHGKADPAKEAGNGYRRRLRVVSYRNASLISMSHQERRPLSRTAPNPTTASQTLDWDTDVFCAVARRRARISGSSAGILIVTLIGTKPVPNEKVVTNREWPAGSGQGYALSSCDFCGLRFARGARFCSSFLFKSSNIRSRS
jgi:hypothetical protein